MAIENNINIHIGEKLREIRESKNITQSQLAKLLTTKDKEYTYNAIHRYEIGEGVFSVEFLYTLCDFFDTTIDYFLSDTKKLIMSINGEKDLILKVEKKNKRKIFQLFSNLQKLSDEKIFSNLLDVLNGLIEIKNKN